MPPIARRAFPRKGLTLRDWTRKAPYDAGCPPRSGAGSPCGPPTGRWKRPDQMPSRAPVQRAHRIPHLGNAKTGTLRALRELPPTPGVTAATALITAVTVAAGPRSGISPPAAAASSLPSTAPAYCLGRPAHLWITAMRTRRSRTASNHLMEAVTVADSGRYSGTAARQPAADAAGRVPLTLA